MSSAVDAPRRREPSPVPHPPDEALLRAIAGGDQEALGALYGRYAARLLGLVRRTLSSQEEAEDVVHDVFLEVWRKAAGYDPARGSVAAWLVVRARSRALDRLKSPHRARNTPLDEGSLGDADDRDCASPDPARALECAEVWRALGDLPPDQRAVVELVYFGGLTLVEVGDCLGVPVGTAKSRLSRATASLRASLAEHDAPG